MVDSVIPAFRDTDGTLRAVDDIHPLPTTGSAAALTGNTFQEVSIRLVVVLDDILTQLKLLNLRTEEGFETRLNERDVK